METVIVQESDESILEVIKVALQMEDFKVFDVIVCDENILSLIENVTPDIVLLEYPIYSKPCIELCKNINSRHPYLPVVALSSNINIDSEYYKYGFVDYIKMPFDLSILYKILRRHILTENCQ